MPEPKDESENCAETERYSEKRTRFRDTDERHQNKTNGNKQPDKMSSPLATANRTEGHKMWILAR